MARHIFGGEPSDPEIHQFILHHYHELNFGEPRAFQLEIKRMNPKRVQRAIRYEMEKVKENSRPSTLAQDYIREEIEKKKKAKKEKSSAQKEGRKEAQFKIKQEKKKEKRRGH